MPYALRRRHFAPKNVEIAVIRANFEESIMRTVPLVENFLDEVVVIIKTKADGPLVRFSPGITFHF